MVELTNLLLITIGDTATRQIIRGKLKNNLIARKNSNIVHTNLAGNMSQNRMTVFKFHLEHRIGQRFDYRTLELNGIFSLSHNTPLPTGTDSTSE